jgi:predicted dehydrogenase
MKKIFSILLGALIVSCVAEKSVVIPTQTPARPAGQQDMLAFAADPIPNVRVAFIGVGMRGPTHVNSMMNIPGVEIVAFCDVLQENTAKCNRMLERKGFPAAQEFYGDTEVWRQVTALPNVDLVVVSTDWKSHAQIAIQAMNDGKHVAVEVPAVVTMQEIWDIIDTSERTRKHCIQLENCVYDFFELTTINMAHEGVFGELKHGEGAYIHMLQPYWDDYWKQWRMDFNRTHRGDVYPTHGLGPVCIAMNMHRGDKMNYLVSVDTKAIGNPEYIKEKTGETVTDFRAGDHTMTMIRTEKERSILIEHDITSPRPYDRMYQISGTKGFANKYPVEGLTVVGGGAEFSETKPNGSQIMGHDFVSQEVFDAMMEKYKHPIVRDIEELARTVGGHGGMDFVMAYRLITCLQKGFPLDMDVYDLAEWCSLIPLSEISLDNNSAPVEIPDFTRGGWNKLSKVTFAQ